MRYIAALLICLVIGMVILYLLGGKKEDVYGYGFYDFVADSFKQPFKDVLFFIVISIVLGLIGFGIIMLIGRGCNWNDEEYEDDFDEERGLRLHTELIIECDNGKESLENTIYCGYFFDYRNI